MDEDSGKLKVLLDRVNVSTDMFEVCSGTSNCEVLLLDWAGPKPIVNRGQRELREVCFLGS